MAELWRDVLGLEGSYQVSDIGNVRSLNRYDSGGHWISGRMLRPFYNHGGYKMIVLSRDGKYKHKQVHRMVLESFIGPAPDGQQCCHWDGVRDNNCLSNLRWDTLTGNQKDIDRHGTRTSGESHPRSKLTDSCVLDIIRRYKDGAKQVDLAKMFGCSQAHISRLVLGRNRACSL